MTVSRAYYVLKENCELHKNQKEYEDLITKRHTSVINGLKKVLEDNGVDDIFDSKQWYGDSRKNIVGLIIKKGEVPKDFFIKYKNPKNCHGWMPKQNSKEGKKLAKELKSITKDIPAKDNNESKLIFKVFDGMKAYSGQVFILNDIPILSYPYLESKGDEPELSDDMKTQTLNRIRPWEFEKMLEEHNLKIKEENEANKVQRTK